MSRLTRIITTSDAAERNLSLDETVSNLSLSELIEECSALDEFRRKSDNLYDRVRALFFLYAIHRFHIPRLVASDAATTNHSSRIPFKGFEHLLQRRFEEALESFLFTQKRAGPNDAISS